MNCLLDTHTFLWTLFEPSQLSSVAKAAIQDHQNTGHVSSVTFWEISLKFSLGKLVLKNCKPEDLIEMIRKLDFEILELRPPEAATFYQLPRTPHKDPFDRMLIWQAIQNDLTLISRDKDFQTYRQWGLKTLW